MTNIITSITGATVRILSQGTRVLVAISGTSEQVQHASTLLYNFHAVSFVSDDVSAPYNEFLVTRKHFMRGLLALVFCHTVERDNGAGRIAGGMAKCVTAIARTAHTFRSMLVPDINALIGKNLSEPLADLSTLADD